MNGKIIGMITTIDSAGRLVIPKAAREKLGLRAGQLVEVRERDGWIEIEPAATAMTLEATRHGLAAVPASPLPRLTDAIVRETIERQRR